MSQWVKIREKASGAQATAGIELDPDFTDTIQEAWEYAEVYIPQDFLDNLGNGDFSNAFIRADGFYMGIRRQGDGSAWHWYVNGDDTPGIAVVAAGDAWYRIEWHLDASLTVCEVKIDGTLYTGVDYNFEVVNGLNFMMVQYPQGTPPTHSPESWVGVDNLAYSLSGWVGVGSAIDDHWDFEVADALNDANANYPTPPWFATFGPGGTVTTLETGAPGPGPGIPPPTGEYEVPLTLTPSATEVVDLSTFGEVYLNLVAVSGGTFVDTETIPMVLSVLGGECFSTWSTDNVGEGDAYTRWSGRANPRWSGDATQRWTANVSVGETIHC